MLQKKILVPLGTSEKSLKSVHHALALAKRIGARVYILQAAASPDGRDPLEAYLEEALVDLINSARQAGLTLSHHIANRDLKEEIIGMAREEGIDLLVFEADDEIARRLLFQVKPLVSSQIIQVKEKDDSDCLKGETPQDPDGSEIQHIPGGGEDRAKARTTKIGRPEAMQKARRDEDWEPGTEAFAERDPAKLRPASGQGGNHEQSVQNTRYR